MLVFRAPPVSAGAVTCWGHDLTAFKHYPICYVSARARDWLELFGLGPADTMASAMEKFLARWPGYFAAPAARWTIDQDALTDCIDAWRGQAGRSYVGQWRGVEPDTFLPLGRLDRYDWRYPAGEILDCHLPRDGYSADADTKVRALYTRLGLATEASWLATYRAAFLAAEKLP
jgi:hypothetical protein